MTCPQARRRINLDSATARLARRMAAKEMTARAATVVEETRLVRPDQVNPDTARRIARATQAGG